AVLQRNEPDPVAPAGEMVRREAPRGEDGAGEGARRVRAGDLDAVHVLDAVVADPDRRGRMRLDRGHAAALAGEERLAARRVDGPAAADVHLRAIGFLDRDRVSPGAVAAEREGRDLRRAPDDAALLGRDLQELLVELRAVELEGRRAGELRGAGLG